MDTDRNGLEVLDRTECLQLLAAGCVGRLGIIAGASPAIFPVNYRLDGDAIIFRTDPGTKLGAGPRSPACFEIDGIDHEHHMGWSVIATGRLEELTPYNLFLFAQAKALGVVPWAAGEKAHWMRLIAERLSGRRIRAVPL